MGGGGCGNLKVPQAPPQHRPRAAASYGWCLVNNLFELNLDTLHGRIWQTMRRIECIALYYRSYTEAGGEGGG